MLTALTILAGAIFTAMLTSYVLNGRLRRPIPRAEWRPWPPNHGLPSKANLAASCDRITAARHPALNSFNDCCWQLESWANEKRNHPPGVRSRTHKSGKRRA